MKTLKIDLIVDNIYEIMSQFEIISKHNVYIRIDKVISSTDGIEVTLMGEESDIRLALNKIDYFVDFNKDLKLALDQDKIEKYYKENLKTF